MGLQLNILPAPLGQSSCSRRICRPLRIRPSLWWMGLWLRSSRPCRRTCRRRGCDRRKKREAGADPAADAWYGYYGYGRRYYGGYYGGYYGYPYGYRYWG